MGMYGYSGDQVQEMMHKQFRAYRATLQEERRHLLERFEVVDVARKVVGVGSVGTRAFIILLQGRDEGDPAVPPGQGGNRIGARGSPPEEQVQGARRARRPGAAADAGGQRHLSRVDERSRGQSPPVLAPASRHEGFGPRRDDDPVMLEFYAGICGWTLARAHARSGDAVALAAYLGKSDKFDRSIIDFSTRYADQSERDYRAFAEAVRSGRLTATEGV